MVDGTAIPDVDYDVGESYAGLIPLGDSTTDEFYFWFFPSDNKAADDEILIWLNGGVSLRSPSSTTRLPSTIRIRHSTTKPSTT